MENSIKAIEHYVKELDALGRGYTHWVNTHRQMFQYLL
ncbi:hypothetical protein N234_19020 [Ralstonia pickettii DTP0602]|nr:hypothetical protein N234_19020 [Ralstonia pickettii DTP0602]